MSSHNQIIISAHSLLSVGQNLQQDIGALLGGGMKIPVTFAQPRCRLTLQAQLGIPVLAAGLVTPRMVGMGRECSRRSGRAFLVLRMWPAVVCGHNEPSCE